MAGSTLGTLFRITTWGESHGAGIGAVVDGCPAGLEISPEDIQKYLNRRRPGQSAFTTGRKEEDRVEILSGVWEGKTEGTPISLLIRNNSQRSGDYANLKDVYRPGHADFGYDTKYGFRDYRGGGRSSGRETAGRVAGGAVAVKLLAEFGISFLTYVDRVGNIAIDPEAFDAEEIWHNPLCMPDSKAAGKAGAYLKDLMEKKDSSGAGITCRIRNVPAGIGEPVFDKLDSALAGAMMSIGAVKAVQIGDGIQVEQMTGSQDNDAFLMRDGKVEKRTNHAGGILGGISDGSEIRIHLSVKPTPSIFQPQQTVTRDGRQTNIEIRGRHDPIIAPRSVVVAETMAAAVIADELLRNSVARLSNLKKIYPGRC